MGVRFHPSNSCKPDAAPNKSLRIHRANVLFSRLFPSPQYSPSTDNRGLTILDTAADICNFEPVTRVFIEANLEQNGSVSHLQWEVKIIMNFNESWQLGSLVCPPSLVQRPDLPFDFLSDFRFFKELKVFKTQSIVSLNGNIRTSQFFKKIRKWAI